MSGSLAWVLVGLGLVTVVVRRRSLAVALVTTEALVLAGFAFAEAAEVADVGAAAALLIRGVLLGVLFVGLILRTRERRPVRAQIPPAIRGALAVAFALALAWLVPSFGLETREAERAVLALLAFGAVLVATRRATLFHVVGIVTVENALALAALEQPGGAPLLIEIGVTVDLLLVAAVAAVFHTRIFEAFGSGDSFALRSLHDR